MSFPEGKKDWFLILRFIVSLIEKLGEVFFGANPNGKDKPSE